MGRGYVKGGMGWDVKGGKLKEVCEGIEGRRGWGGLIGMEAKRREEWDVNGVKEGMGGIDMNGWGGGVDGR